MADPTLQITYLGTHPSAAKCSVCGEEMPKGEVRATTDAELTDWFERGFKTHLRQKHSRYVWDGKEYEIRPIGTPHGWEVSTYLDGKKVGSTVHGPYDTVHELNASAALKTGTTAVDELIEVAKGNIRLGGHHVQ
jgi:hypothetical protein